MSTRTPQAWIMAIERIFREEASIDRATHEKAYLKSDLVFIGITVPRIRLAAKDFRRTFPRLAQDEVRDAARMLWAPGVHELRSLAIAIVELYVPRLDDGAFAQVEAMLRESVTWAHVDWLAVKVAGPLVDRHPRREAILEAWSEDTNFWMRRAAMLALLEPLRAGQGDFETFSRFAEKMLDEKEFFIRKAIGWVLREVSKKRPDLTCQFLDAHHARASGLTLREASRQLPEAQRARFVRPRG
ncbi:MAG TPA: DNA alkylation repair protein [Pantanalinema sp.]